MKLTGRLLPNSHVFCKNATHSWLSQAIYNLFKLLYSIIFISRFFKPPRVHFHIALNVNMNSITLVR